MKSKYLISLIILIFSDLYGFSKVNEIDDIWDIQYNNRPMVIEAYASWCQPCKVYGPIVERLSQEYEGRVDFYKVNIDNPDSEDFIYRYEVGSVPLTVFLWDPQGDATVKHSIERGLMGYVELRNYIEETLSKHYTNVKPQPSITDFIDYSSTGKLSSWPEVPIYGKMPFTPDSNISQYLGTWIGEEDGDESIIKFWEEEDLIYCSAATNGSHRLAVYSTPYWWVGAYRWEVEYNGIWLSDVISSTPKDFSDSSQIQYGFYRDKILRIQGDELVVTVKEFKDWANWNNHIVNREYTCYYRRL